MTTLRAGGGAEGGAGVQTTDLGPGAEMGLRVQRVPHRATLASLGRWWGAAFLQQKRKSRLREGRDVQGHRGPGQIQGLSQGS